MLKTILEVSVISLLFVIVGLVIYLLYTRHINQILKGTIKKKVGRSLEFRLLVLSIVGILTIFGYVLVKYTIEQNMYKSFSVEISTDIHEFSFNDFYADLYQSSNADADIMVGRDRVIHILLDTQGRIKEFSLIVLIPKDGQLVEYAGVLSDNKIVFRTAPSIVNPSVFHFKLQEHTQRLSKVDFETIFNTHGTEQASQGLWIDINLSYIWGDEPVTHNNLIDSYSIDNNNNIDLIDSITFNHQSSATNIWIGRAFIDNQNQIGAIHVITYYLVD